MRRLLLFGLVVVLSGLLVASAATLDVDGGVLQVLRFDVNLEVPAPADTIRSTLVIDPTTTMVEVSSTTTTVSLAP